MIIDNIGQYPLTLMSLDEPLDCFAGCVEASSMIILEMTRKQSRKSVSKECNEELGAVEI